MSSNYHVIVFMNNRELKLQCDPADTIMAIKLCIEQTWGWPVDQQRLIYCGKVLNNDKVLCDYNIQSSGRIQMVFGLRGS